MRYATLVILAINIFVTQAQNTGIKQNVAPALNTENYNCRLKAQLGLPDSVKFSDRIVTNISKNFYNIYDYNVNKSTLLGYDLTEQKIVSNLTIKGKDFKPGVFFSTGTIDTGAYRIYYKYMKYMGRTSAHIDNVFLCDTALYLVIDFPTPIKIGADTSIGGKLYVYYKNLKTQKKQLYTLVETELVKENEPAFYLNYNSAFFVKESTFYFGLITLNNKLNFPVLSSFEKNGTEIGKMKITKFSIPDSAYNDLGRAVNNFAAKSNSEFYFGANYPYVIDIRTQQTFVVKELLPYWHKGSFEILDVVSAGKGRCVMLVKIEEQLHFLEYDYRAYQLSGFKQLSNLNNVNINTLKFLNTNSLIGIGLEKKYLNVYELNNR